MVIKSLNAFFLKFWIMLNYACYRHKYVQISPPPCNKGLCKILFWSDQYFWRKGRTDEGRGKNMRSRGQSRPTLRSFCFLPGKFLFFQRNWKFFSNFSYLHRKTPKNSSSLDFEERPIWPLPLMTQAMSRPNKKCLFAKILVVKT